VSLRLPCHFQPPDFRSIRNRTRLSDGFLFGDAQTWTGSVRQGRRLEDAKFVQEWNALRVTTGPATTFWNPANRARY